MQEGKYTLLIFNFRSYDMSYLELIIGTEDAFETMIKAFACQESAIQSNKIPLISIAKLTNIECMIILDFIPTGKSLNLVTALHYF